MCSIAGPGQRRQGSVARTKEWGLSSGALDTVWLQPVRPDIDYMTTLQSCFRVVLVNYLIDSEECEWSFFFGAIMPEAPPAVGSAIVAQSVGKNNKTCSE